MSDFAAFLHELGLRPARSPEPDGKWYRCPTEDHPKKKNGAYKLATDGLIGWAQNHALHDEPITWRPAGELVTSAPDVRTIRQAQAQEQLERDAAIAGAREFYQRCPALIGGHPYLAQKGLDMTGCQGVKRGPGDWLVVPMVRAGHLVSVQRIHADGTKRFWPGAPTRGTTFIVDRRGATVTVLCEGVATGLALFAAVPLARVIVAFTASNLVKVASQLPRRGMVVVAADNDHETAERIGRNPGVDAAREAAALLGCGVAIPEGIMGSDFADMRQERIQAVASRPLYGARTPSELATRRTVDAEIAFAVLGAARFLSVAG